MNSGGAETALEGRREAHDLAQCRLQVPRRREEPVELPGHADLLAVAQLGEDVLLRREVEEERAVRDPGRRRRSHRRRPAATPARLNSATASDKQALPRREPLGLLEVIFSVAVIHDRTYALC